MARCFDPPIEGVAFNRHKWGRALTRRPRGDRHSSHQAGRSGNGTDVLAPRSGDPPRMHANGPPDHKERDLLMAKENPTDGGRAVALTISSKDRELLRRVFTMALDGIRDELDNYPDDLREPTHLHREEGIYERLLAGLAGESIVPDHYMRQPNSAATFATAAGGPASPRKTSASVPTCTEPRSASWSVAPGCPESTR